MPVWRSPKRNVVERPRARLAHQGEHPRGAVGEVGAEPRLKHAGDLERQAEQDVAGPGGARRRAGGEDALQLGVVDAGDHRRREHAGRDAGACQFGDGGDAAGGRRGAGFHAAGEVRIEGGDGQADMDEVAGGKALEDVEVAQHAGGFGHDRHRMTESLQHLQHGAGELERALHRLVGVGVGAERHRPGDVAGLAELALQQRRELGLEVEQGLEVEAGGVAEIGVGGAGVAVDAAMLAAAIGVDRAIEAEVGAGVPSHGALGAVLQERGRERRQLGEVGERVPAVIEGLAGRGLEADRRVGHGAAALAEAGQDGRVPLREAVGHVPFPLCSGDLAVRGRAVSRTESELVVKGDRAA